MSAHRNPNKDIK